MRCEYQCSYDPCQWPYFLHSKVALIGLHWRVHRTQYYRLQDIVLCTAKSCTKKCPLQKICGCNSGEWNIDSRITWLHCQLTSDAWNTSNEVYITVIENVSKCSDRLMIKKRGAVLISRYCLTNIGIPVIKTRWYHNFRIFLMWVPMLENTVVILRQYFIFLVLCTIQLSFLLFEGGILDFHTSSILYEFFLIINFIIFILHGHEDWNVIR